MLYNAAQSRILQSGSSKHHWSDLTYRQGSSPGNRNTHHGHASNIVRSRAGQPAHVQPRKTNERVWINKKFSSYNLRVKVNKVTNVHNQSRTFEIFIPTALQFRCRCGFDVGRNGFGPSWATLYTLHIVSWLYSAVQLITKLNSNGQTD